MLSQWNIYGLRSKVEFNRVETRLTQRTKESTMGSTIDKTKGGANEAAGNLKKATGKAVGSTKLQAKGAAQEVKGKAQIATGKAKSATKKAVSAIAGKTNKAL